MADLWIHSDFATPSPSDEGRCSTDRQWNFQTLFIYKLYIIIELFSPNHFDLARWQMFHVLVQICILGVGNLRSKLFEGKTECEDNLNVVIILNYTGNLCMHKVIVSGTCQQK